KIKGGEGRGGGRVLGEGPVPGRIGEGRLEGEVSKEEEEGWWRGICAHHHRLREKKTELREDRTNHGPPTSGVQRLLPGQPGLQREPEGV
ncbi:hypothetical protein AB205_0205460, partial [Aquarana catesbeiana]